MNINFKHWQCVLQAATYNNNRIVLRLVDSQNFAPIATCTVNLPDVKLLPDEVCIKDYSENQGMLNTLVDAGVLSQPLCHIQSGYVSIPICKLLIDIDNL